MSFLKHTTSLADDLLGLCNWVMKRLEAPGKVHNPGEAIGSKGEISIPIKSGGIGEIVVVMRHSLQHYPARAHNPEKEFKKGEKVRIVSVGTNFMFVDTYTEEPAINAQAQIKETRSREESCGGDST